MCYDSRSVKRRSFVRSAGRSIKQSINHSRESRDERFERTSPFYLSRLLRWWNKRKKERTSERENGDGMARGRDHFEIHLKEKKKKTERESRTRREESTRMSSRNSLKKEKKRTRKRRKNKNFKTKIKIWRWTKISSPCRAHVEVKTDAAERGYYRRTSSPRLLRSRWFTTMHDGERERKIRFVSRCVRRSKLISLKKKKKQIVQCIIQHVIQKLKEPIKDAMYIYKYARKIGNISRR